MVAAALEPLHLPEESAERFPVASVSRVTAHPAAHLDLEMRRASPAAEHLAA